MAEINNNICKPVANLDEMTRRDWLEKRRSGIGGSDAGAVLGMNEYKSPIAVWQEKTNRTPIDESDNDYLRIGRDLEDYVASRFEEETGLKVYKCRDMLQSVENPFMFADVDRLVEGEDAGLEIKTVSPYKSNDWDGGNIPKHYELQCNHYMAVTGLSKWYICALIYPHIEIRVIERDDELIDTLITLEKDFWDKYVTTDEMPPVDGSRATSEVLDSVYPEAVPESIELDDLEALMKRRDEALDMYERLDDEIEEIENIIKAKMGRAETAYIGDYKVTWGNRKAREMADTKKMKEDGIFDKYKKVGRPYRVFSVKNGVQRND